MEDSGFRWKVFSASGLLRRVIYFICIVTCQSMVGTAAGGCSGNWNKVVWVVVRVATQGTKWLGRQDT